MYVSKMILVTYRFDVHPPLLRVPDHEPNKCFMAFLAASRTAADAPTGTSDLGSAVDVAA